MRFEIPEKKQAKIEWPKRPVLIATNEQRPWSFPSSKQVNLGIGGGDYTLEGLEDYVRIERKGLDDMVGSLRRNFNKEERTHIANMAKKGKRARIRTPAEKLKAEFSQMKANGVSHRYLVIEGTLREIVQWRYHGGMHPSAVLGHLIRWEVRYGIHVVFAETHVAANDYARRIFLACEAVWEEENGVEDNSALDVRGESEGAPGSTGTRDQEDQ